MRITQIEVKGFKSLKNVTINFSKSNVLIGINGAGKSNLLQLFEFISKIRQGNLKYYTNLMGGASKLTFMGAKTTRNVDIKISFEDYNYVLLLEVTKNDQFQILKEKVETSKGQVKLSSNEIETKFRSDRLENLPTEDNTIYEILEYLSKLRRYHFSDTTSESGIRTGSPKNDNRVLSTRGTNLASILYLFKEKFPKTFKEIEQVISLIAPFFKRFDLRVDPLSKDKKILLEWRHRWNDQLFGPLDLSDGILRAMAILVTIYQSHIGNQKERVNHHNTKLSLICIDEPELGLHPKAISYIAETIRSKQEHVQILIATQSPKFVDQYDLDDIIILEYKNGETTIKDLNIPQLEDWLEDYSTGDLWEKNLLGGRP